MTCFAYFYIVLKEQESQTEKEIKTKYSKQKKKKKINQLWIYINNTIMLYCMHSCIKLPEQINVPLADRDRFSLLSLRATKCAGVRARASVRVCLNV